MRRNPVKRALKAGQPSVGTWLSLGSITAARFMARAGFAWLTVDIEHSLVDWETATHMFASIADAGCVALARVPANRHDHIKRVLDNGAHGVVVPMVNSREEAERRRRRLPVSAGRQPQRRRQRPRAQLRRPPPTIISPTPTTKMLIVLQCEHIQAVENADEIFSVPGIDAIFVGPNDLAASMRSKDGKPPSGEATTQAMKHVLATCKKHSVAAGIHCFSAEEARQRIEEGWQFLAIGSELKMMLDGVKHVLDRLGLKKEGENETQMAKY